jgi:predicted transcriptional regulator
MQSFQDIDARRSAAGLTRKAVYEAAGLHKETWRRLDKGQHEPNVATLKKLSAAIEQLEKGKGNGTDHQ